MNSLDFALFDFLFLFLHLIWTLSFLAFPFFPHGSGTTTVTIPAASFAFVLLLLDDVFRWWRILRSWQSYAFEDCSECWICFSTAITKIFFDRFRFFFCDVDAITVIPFLAIVTCNHKSRRVTWSANTVSDIFFLEDCCNFRFSLGELIKLLCDFFFLKV